LKSGGAFSTALHTFLRIGLLSLVEPMRAVVRAVSRARTVPRTTAASVVRAIFQVSDDSGSSRASFSVGSVMLNTAPLGSLGAAHNRPPCASTIERQIDKPMPKPFSLVV
jgi:hypothetical protein